MNEAKKKRGRPLGAESDDSRELSAMADMIVADPKLRPTTAYKKIDPCWTDASVRRMQDKWKMRREALLAQANQRRDEQRSQESTRNTANSGIGWRYLEGLTAGGQLKQLQMLHDSPAMRTIKADQNAPFALAMKASEFGSLGQIRKTTENSAISTLMNTMKNDPVYRLMEEQRRIRELLNPFGSYLSPFGL